MKLKLLKLSRDPEITLLLANLIQGMRALDLRGIVLLYYHERDVELHTLGRRNYRQLPILHQPIFKKREQQ
jgi:hypothetical protein